MLGIVCLIAAVAVNPVLPMDFPDPDACIGHDGRVYLVASSFGGLPGLPILVSEDCVNWSYAGHALERHPFPTISPEHGNSVWAPSIRYRADKEEYVIYWGDPDRGAFRTSARRPEGPWSAPRKVIDAKGMIDVCPLYDDDGRIYLVNAWAASRAGKNSVLTVRELDAGEERELTPPVMVYDGLREGNHTTEGPKFYKKDGEYWLWFPAGGVSNGWQVAARAKNVYGPYETRVVLAQGKTDINGPHQGAAVKLNGQWRFLHFRDCGIYGRVVYLEPMVWESKVWPVIGKGGEPCRDVVYDGAPQQRFGGLSTSDDFSSVSLAPQWQFLGRPREQAAWPTADGFFRIYSVRSPAEVNLWNLSGLMVQKFPDTEFSATLTARISAKESGTDSGLVVMGRSYARLGLRFKSDEGENSRFELIFASRKAADGQTGSEDIQVLGAYSAIFVPAGARPAHSIDVKLRVSVADGGVCRFACSVKDGEWKDVPGTFMAASGKWIGATVGAYAIAGENVKDLGWIDLQNFAIAHKICGDD